MDGPAAVGDALRADGGEPGCDAVAQHDHHRRGYRQYPRHRLGGPLWPAQGLVRPEPAVRRRGGPAGDHSGPDHAGIRGTRSTAGRQRDLRYAAILASVGRARRGSDLCPPGRLCSCPQDLPRGLVLSAGKRDQRSSRCDHREYSRTDGLHKAARAVLLLVPSQDRSGDDHTSLYLGL